MITVELLTKLKLSGEVNVMCTTMMSQCDHYVTMVINHLHINHDR